MDDEIHQPLLGSPDEEVKGNGKKSTLLTVCPYILANEFCERLAFYGLATNLVSYIKKVLGGSSAAAAVEVAIFEGTAYMTPLLGAVVADSRWGRYKTIMVFSSIYFMGMVSLTLTSCVPGLRPIPGDEANVYQRGALWVALGIIAVGTGGIKPNVAAFGADQFDVSNPRDRREKASFFNYFYLAINIGSLLASTVIVYIQDNISWTVGFAVPGVAMFLAVVCFVGGRKVYKHVPPTESPVMRVFRVVRAAIVNRWHPHPPPVPELVYQDSMSGTPNRRDSMLAMPFPSRSYGWLQNAVTEWQTAQGHVLSQRSGLGGYTPKQVEEVKMVLRMMPVFWSTVLYWTVYQQMASLFVQQGFLMDNTLQLGAGSMTFNVPPASMSLFNTFTIVAIIPVYDRLLEPLVRRLGGRITLLQRIGWGMLLSIAAMVVAAQTERMRLSHFRDTGRTDLSILWQAPQYLLVGLSEVFASIGQLEFFYDQAPDVMRSCSMAMQLVSTALGSYLAGILLLAVAEASSRWAEPWLPADLNYGHMDLFFWLLAVLSVLNFAAYLAVAMRYEYKVVQHTLSVVRPPTVGQVPTRPPGLPSGLPRTPAPTVGITIGSSRRTQPFYSRGEESSSEPNSLSQYGRSLAFYPTSPALPAPFR